MSTRIMALVWPLQMPPSPKAVLVSLADNANDSGGAFPSIGYICERTCLGRTAVIEAIKWLEAAGYLKADRSNGRHTRYQLTLDHLPLVVPKPVRQADRYGSRTGPAGAQDQSGSRTGPVRQPDTNRQEHKDPLSPGAREPVAAAEGEQTQPRGTSAPAPTLGGEACLLMREAGLIATNPSHAELLKALAAGVPPQAFADTVRELIAAGKRHKVTLAYVVSVTLGRHQDAQLAPAPVAGQGARAGPGPSATRQAIAGLQGLKSNLDHPEAGP